jgi:hypothetical protein
MRASYGADKHFGSYRDGWDLDSQGKIISCCSIEGAYRFLISACYTSGWFLLLGWHKLGFLFSNYNRLYDDSIYAITGVGYSASGNTENNVLFSTLKAYDTTGFSVSGNQITVGKSGTYLVSFNSALKKQLVQPMRIEPFILIG